MAEMESSTASPWEAAELISKIALAYGRAGAGASWENEERHVRNALKQISPHLPARRYHPVDVIGVGGSGVVLRIKDSLFPDVDNALKFPRPIDGQAHLVASMVAKELQFLSSLRHPGIVKMLYYRTIEEVSPYGKLPFYLMEAVDGESTTTYFSTHSVSQAEFLNIIQRAAESIQYLHSNASGVFVHLDIKPQNIAITRSGVPVLLDLGTCKRLSGDHERTILAVSMDTAHPDLVRLLAQGKEYTAGRVGTIERSEINPRWDLWAFANTILLWLGVRPSDGAVGKDAYLETLDIYSRKYLFLLVARLLTESTPKWLINRVGLSEEFIKEMAVTTAADLVAQIAKLTGTRGPLDLIPELQNVSSGSIQAAPGVHVPSTRRLIKTLEHRLFRRLSAVTQLGIVSQIFPSAKHTRREHSLGTYGNVCRMIKALYNDSMSPLFKHVIEANDILEIMLASLLHDLGQFPMAHDLEDVAPRVFDHEELTLAMLKGAWQKKKAGSKTVKFEPLGDIYEMWETTADRIIAVLSAKAKSNSSTAKDKLLRSIISGPIDADKLDYLFRDARYTDVPYPNGIDVDRLFRCLTTVVLPTIAGGTTNVPVIGIHAKGKVAAEFMTMARYAMFSQVYWHHAVRAQKAMLSRAVAALLAPLSGAKLAAFTSDFIEMVYSLPESLYRQPATGTQLHLGQEVQDGRSHHLGLGTDLSATDSAVLTWIYDRLVAGKLREAELVQGLLSRALFKRLWIIGKDSVVSADWDELCNLWDQLSPKQRNRAAIEYERKIAGRLSSGNAIGVTVLAAEDAITLLKQLSGAQAPWLLVDLPGAKSGSDVGLNYVTEGQARRMRKDDRAMGDLQRSLAWERYARDLRDVAGNIRVFCDERLVETLDASMSQKIGFEDLLAVVQAERSSSD